MALKYNIWRELNENWLKREGGYDLDPLQWDNLPSEFKFQTDAKDELRQKCFESGWPHISEATLHIIASNPLTLKTKKYLKVFNHIEECMICQDRLEEFKLLSREMNSHSAVNVETFVSASTHKSMALNGNLSKGKVTIEWYIDLPGVCNDFWSVSIIQDRKSGVLRGYLNPPAEAKNWIDFAVIIASHERPVGVLLFSPISLKSSISIDIIGEDLIIEASLRAESTEWRRLVAFSGRPRPIWPMGKKLRGHEYKTRIQYINKPSQQDIQEYVSNLLHDLSGRPISSDLRQIGIQKAYGSGNLMRPWGEVVGNWSAEIEKQSVKVVIRPNPGVFLIAFDEKRHDSTTIIPEVCNINWALQAMKMSDSSQTVIRLAAKEKEIKVDKDEKKDERKKRTFLNRISLHGKIYSFSYDKEHKVYLESAVGNDFTHICFGKRLFQLLHIEKNLYKIMNGEPGDIALFIKKFNKDQVKYTISLLNK